ncbi:MAG: hypothetical protein WDO18_20670 [Acidobacteriota bacterium]
MSDQSANLFIAYKFKKHALGGDVYERMVVEGLSGAFDVVPHAMIGGGGGAATVAKSPILAWKLARASSMASKQCPVGIFSADAFLLPFRFSRNVIGIVHHVGASSNTLFATFESKIIERLRSAHRVIVVSKFWEEYFKGLGFTNLELIYNGFTVEEYRISEAAAADFKVRHGLTDKPIIYLGNNGPLKGVQKTRAALKGIDAHFVASGRAADSSDGLVSLRLDRLDYLRLLAASTVVVTMSEFDEGWCRTAHEGMLMRTPVIGSGRGGCANCCRAGSKWLRRIWTNCGRRCSPT